MPTATEKLTASATASSVINALNWPFENSAKAIKLTLSAILVNPLERGQGDGLDQDRN